MVTESQRKLFGLIADFVRDTVVGWVSLMYDSTGPGILIFPDIMCKKMIQFAEVYFNEVARWIYSREDQYINAKFDEMAAVPLAGTNHPIDILQVIVMLTLTVVNHMDIKAVATASRETMLGAVKVHVEALVRRYAATAKDLIGCTPDHIHEPITAQDKVFTFTLDKYIEHESQMVKLTRL